MAPSRGPRATSTASTPGTRSSLETQSLRARPHLLSQICIFTRSPGIRADETLRNHGPGAQKGPWGASGPTRCLPCVGAEVEAPRAEPICSRSSLATHWVGRHRPQDPDPRPRHPALPAQSWAWAWAPSGRQWCQAMVAGVWGGGGGWNLPTALGMWTVGVPETAKVPSLTRVPPSEGRWLLEAQVRPGIVRGYVTEWGWTRCSPVRPQWELSVITCFVPAI